MIAAARFVQFLSTMILFGSSLFYLYGFKDRYEARWPKRLLAASAPVALVSLGLWIMLEAASLSGNASDAFDPAFLWSMLSETGFGKVFLFRLIAACAACAALALLWKSQLKLLARAEAMLGALLLASVVGTGHGAGGEGANGAWRSMIDVLHLLSSGVWVGALVPLAILVSRSARGGEEDGARAHYALERFSGVGTAVVLVLIHSGIVNTWFMIGSAPISALFTSSYGIVLLLKIGLFFAMLALAAINRFWLTPHLSRALRGATQIGQAGAMLRMSVWTETGLAVLVLIAVGLLGTMEPPGT